ncbi:phage major capsid protein [Streptomyces sp. NPDC051546]|uniref:phage major capsid protein n=1 Tax=Streptomyces sp. NPDC051546 TaxID=3365655 RepID=UPI0037ACBB9D
MRLTLTTPLRAEAAAEGAPRSVSGRIVEYGVRAHPSGPFGAVTFAPGSIQAEGELSRVKLLRDHDTHQPLGVLAELTETPEGLDATFRMGRHAAATDALVLAEDGVLDGLSVGVEPLEWSDDKDGQGVTVTRARLYETSLVPLPAYAGARTTRVVAAEREAPMDPNTPPPPAPVAPAPALDIAAEVRRVLEAERAPSAHAPLTPERFNEHPAALSFARAVDREGYGRSLPGIVVGRDRVDAADYLHASCELIVNGERGPWERVTRVLAAVDHEVTSYVPGLLPQVITGPIMDRLAPLRPVWNSLTQRTMPSTSQKFSRPRVKVHTKVDKQTGEKTELVNQAMQVVLEDISKDTYGGYVNISRQVLDWTSPGALALVVEDLMANLVRQSEARAATDLVLAAAAQKVTGDLTDPAALNGLIYQASAQVYGANDSNNSPADRVWMSPDIWAQIGSMVDGNKRPLFPALNPSNALGSLRPANPTGGDFGGFQVVVSGSLPAKTLIVGASEALEVYEDQRGTLQAVEPSVLGLQVAAYCYLATYRAQPKELVSLTQKPAP